MQALRYRDPGVKLWLAIGGWTFNDDDQPTRTTFSDIVGNEAIGDKFIYSLIRVMQVYGFDGVDLDWEYPGAPDRSGRPTDFANYPPFLRRLRQALRTANSDYGLSITIPISFWYLQHFDIKTLQTTVDWMNVMSYDLHGKWDLTTDYGKEHGATINAHTNLTEIKDMLDLLWRNNVDPQLVNLGLAFYGRSATAASSSCVSPGCPFVSSGNAGACSGEAGVLLNTEISDIIQTHGLTPTFDREAAVKHISWDGNQWVSFDDADTLKIKADFVKSSCLGGVMVWAISHDSRAGDNALALSKALGATRTPLPGGLWTSGLRPFMTDQDRYCRWSNCGHECPVGFAAVIDYSLKDAPVSIYGGSCGLQTWCCPKTLPIPKCNMGQPSGIGRGGQCTNGGCADGQVEVGSENIGCWSSGYVSVCCDNSPPVQPYAQCKWIGTAPMCGSEGPLSDASCTADFPYAVAASPVGSGQMPACAQGNYVYCCNQKGGPKAFRRCKTERGPDDNTLCSTDCPIGSIQIAQSTDSCSADTKNSYCCYGELPEITEWDPSAPQGRSQSEQIAELDYYLRLYSRNPTCPAITRLQQRALEYRRSHFELRDSNSLTPSGFNMLVSLLSIAMTTYTLNPDMARMLRTYFYTRDVASPEELHDYMSNRERDPVDIITDFLCDRRAVTEDIRERAGADTDLCLSDDHLSERHVTADVSMKWHDKRVIERPNTNNPNAATIFNGIHNGELAFHYARFQEARGFGDYEFIMEIAYWIGPEVGVAPNPSTVAQFRSNLLGTDVPDVNQRWVVFHIHFSRNTNEEVAANPAAYSLFRIVPGTTNGILYPTASIVNVFHASEIETFRNGAAARVYGRDSEVNRMSERRTLMACPVNSPVRRFWRAGSPVASRDVWHSDYSALMTRWGVSLRNQGILTPARFARPLYPSATSEEDVQRAPYNPLPNAFHLNFGAPGQRIIDPDSLDAAIPRRP